MGLGLAMVICVAIFVIVGFMVFQARFAATHWRRVIREGDPAALAQLLDDTFESWRRERPKRGTPPADWRAMHTAALVAADSERIRVSILAEPDVQVISGERVEVSSAQVVARRAAIRMVERLMYEVPYASFDHAQVDVLTEYRTPDGPAVSRCLLTTRVTREQARYAEWEDGVPEEVLGEWTTLEVTGDHWPDPDVDAIIHPWTAEALRAAEDAINPATTESRESREPDDAPDDGPQRPERPQGEDR